MWGQNCFVGFLARVFESSWSGFPGYGFPNFYQFSTFSISDEINHWNRS